MVYMIYLLTATGLTTGGSSTVQYSTVHIYTQTVHRTTQYPERNIHNNKNTKFTKLNRSPQNIQP